MERTLTAIAALVISIALGSCGGSGSGTAPAVAPGGASGNELAAEQVLHWGNGAEPQGIDPHKSEGVPGSNIQRDLFDGLVNEAPNGELIPGGAASWNINADGTTYTFNLRRAARWSNGDPVTAHDWVYGLQRSADPVTGSRYTFILESILNAARFPPASCRSTRWACGRSMTTRSRSSSKPQHRTFLDC